MTESEDQSGKAETAESPGKEEVSTSAPAQAPGSPSQVLAGAEDQVGKLIKHPAFKGFLGKSIKLVALFAVLGCLLMLAAINALCSLINNALPH